MITAVNLAKYYGSVCAVDDLSFSIPKGEILGLLGPNGAGKTTTMRMLTTFLPPSRGTALIAGYDVSLNPEQVRREIGYLPENPPIYPEMKVDEYLTFWAKVRGLSDREARAAVISVIDKCALGPVSSRICAALSRGYRQRVGIAQALVHNPSVVILDEPTSGLDPAQIVSTRALISSLKQEHTVLLSTHILREVEEVCTSALILAGGRVVVQGSLAELTKEKGLEQFFLEAVAR